MSAALPDPFKAEWWSPGFEELLIGLTHYPSFSLLVTDIAEMREEVSTAAAAWFEKAKGL
jgi:glutamate-ammonia-ligase adenylyltransferase